MWERLPVSWRLILLRSLDGTTAVLKSAVSGIDLKLPGQFYAPLAMHPRQPQFVAFSNSRVYETTRNDTDGVQWGEVGQPFASDDFGGVIAYAPAKSEVLYVSSVRGELFVRTQRGGTFESRKNGLPPSGASALAVADGDAEGQVVFATFPRFDGRSVFVSRDQGRNWQNISSNLPQVAVRALALDGSDVYVGGDAGVFHLTTAGCEKVGQHLPPTQVHDLQIGQNPHRLAVGTHGQGLWEISLNGEPLAPP
ncbi:hypothetical protein JST97_13880 [bacterium]|nr:hypothetical protein [bacterium]